MAGKSQGIVVGSMGVAGLMGVAAILDLALGFPFGHHVHPGIRIGCLYGHRLHERRTLISDIGGQICTFVSPGRQMVCRVLH